MSINNRNLRFRDPFYSAPLPRTYYHPSRTRDVDNNVAIQGPERQEPSKGESPFELGSTFKLSALPQLENGIHQSHVSQEFDDMDSRSEQPSNSTLLDTTQLTSSIDEKDKSASRQHEFSHLRGEGHGMEGTISTIQKYIDRFRYSAPKSREERENEKSQKQKTLWWLNSDSPPSRGLEKPSAKGSTTQPFTDHVQRLSRPTGGRQLTREAVLELDKETSDLQQKADKLLSKSQLSLASSGPCVSTDGLGSSTALSECSYQTDPQPSYRPIFVNLQGNVGEYNREPVASKEKFQTIEEEYPMSPNDVLARWRMRRKMGEAQQRNTRMPTTRVPSRNNSEIDVKLREFRKKLFAQRVLVTSEDIQFERQKMKMMIDDEEDHMETVSTKQMQVPQPKNQENSLRLLPQEDPILSRLRQITNTGNALSTGHRSDLNPSQKILNNQGDCICVLSETEINKNSHNATTPARDDRGYEFISSIDHSALNTNNTALNQNGLNNQGSENYLVDEIKSVNVFDPTQRSFCLNTSAVGTNDDAAVVVNLEAVCDGRGARELSESTGDIVNNQQEQQENEFVNSDTEENSSHSTEYTSNQNTHYHQRLEAEKPCGESDMHTEKKHGSDRRDKRSTNTRKSNKYGAYDSDNSVSSTHSGRKDKPVHSKKKMQHKMCKSDNLRFSNNEEFSDSSFRKSDRSLANSNKDRTDEKENNGATVMKKTSNSGDAKLKPVCKEDKAEEAHPGVSLRKEVPAPQPQQAESIRISVSQSSHHNNIHKVIGETVVDHLFDGPSMISSVDSWASLFPQSPSHSLYNSTVVTPTKDNSSSTNQQTTRSCTPSPSGQQQRLLSPPATPTPTPPHRHSRQQQIVTSTPQHSDPRTCSPVEEMEDVRDTADTEDRSKDSSEEFENDPLMSLLLQQRKEYLHKLELIELKLQQFEDEDS